MGSIYNPKKDLTVIVQIFRRPAVAPVNVTAASDQYPSQYVALPSRSLKHVVIVSWLISPLSNAKNCLVRILSTGFPAGCSCFGTLPFDLVPHLDALSLCRPMWCMQGVMRVGALSSSRHPSKPVGCILIASTTQISLQLQTCLLDSLRRIYLW